MLFSLNHSYRLFFTWSPPPCCGTVFGVEPDLTREGGSIPVTLTFQEATGRNVMLLPVGSSDDGAHSQNEKLNRYAIEMKGSFKNVLKGVEMFVIAISITVHTF